MTILTTFYKLFTFFTIFLHFLTIFYPCFLPAPVHSLDCCTCRGSSHLFRSIFISLAQKPFWATSFNKFSFSWKLSFSWRLHWVFLVMYCLKAISFWYCDILTYSWKKCYFFRDPVFCWRNFLIWQRRFPNIEEEFSLKISNFAYNLLILPNIS